MIGIQDEGYLFERESHEGGYKSQELDGVLRTIEAALARG